MNTEQPQLETREQRMRRLLSGTLRQHVKRASALTFTPGNALKASDRTQGQRGGPEGWSKNDHGSFAENRLLRGLAEQQREPSDLRR